MMRCGEIEILHTSTPAFAWRKGGWVFPLDDPQFNGKTAMASTRKCLHKVTSPWAAQIYQRREGGVLSPALSKLR